MKKFLFLLLLMTPCFLLKAQDEDPDLQYATELLKPGTEVPEMKLNDLRGKERSLSEFRGRKVVLVFWASWCPDCRAEIPELKAMQAGANPEKVAFVSVSFDRDFDTLCSFVEDNNLGGVQLYDPAGKKESKVGADFHVRWIPSLYLIDENGKVIISTVVAGKVAAELKKEKKPAPKIMKMNACSDEGCSLK